MFECNVYALDIDEKLTLRFLKVSNSKKTVLINRGAEDGIVVGDHAKFFITSGIIARGMVEKVSPSRSIWSLYRVIEPNEIMDGKVLNLKIASPVKVTADPSKSLKDEDVPAGSDKMSLETSNESDKKIDNEDLKELDEMGIKVDNSNKSKKDSNTKKNDDPIPTVDNKSSSDKAIKTWEIWLSLSLSSLSGSYDSSAAVVSTETISKNMNYSIGVEKYLFEFGGIWKKFSLLGFIQNRSSESALVTKTQIKNNSSWFEYGAGVNFHFYNAPEMINTIIGFGGISFGTGSGSITEKGTVTNDSEVTASGKNNFMAFGLGAKYFLSNSFGMRFIFDYFTSNESIDFTGASLNRNLSGPRMQLGLSYKF